MIGYALILLAAWAAVYVGLRLGYRRYRRTRLEAIRRAALPAYAAAVASGRPRHAEHLGALLAACRQADYDEADRLLREFPDLGP